MAVSKRLRYEVLRRDDFTCRYCGAKAPDAPLRVDHVTPVALGGSDDPTNLVTACEPCNNGKTSTIEGFVAAPRTDLVPPSPEVLGDEVERIWLDAYNSLHGSTGLTLSMLNEVQSSAREMYEVGLKPAHLRRSATVAGLMGETHIGLNDSCDFEAMAATSEAFRLWRSLWHRSTGHAAWPDMQDIFLFECSVEMALNAGVERLAILRASALAGYAQGCYIEDHLVPVAQAGGTN